MIPTQMPPATAHRQVGGGVIPYRGAAKYKKNDSPAVTAIAPIHSRQPILNRNQGTVAAAEAERTVAAAQVEAVRLSVQSEVASARARDEHARRALDAYSADAIALATQNLAVIRQTYELGRGTLLDVLNEQRRYLDVERAYTDVLREAYEARQTLKTAMGEVR